MQRPDCLWCDKKLTVAEMKRGHLCSKCQQVSTGIPGLSNEQLDLLPFGIIELNEDGTVVAFNTAEESLSHRSKDEVIGLNFFSEVAPCADVKEYHGRFREFLKGKALTEKFNYTYYFKSSTLEVELTFLKVNRQLAFVLSKRTER